jgi:hypothetical protein
MRFSKKKLEPEQRNNVSWGADQVGTGLTGSQTGPLKCNIELHHCVSVIELI